MTKSEKKYARICLKTIANLTSKAVLKDIHEAKAAEENFEMAHSELLDELETLHEFILEQKYEKWRPYRGKYR